VYLNRNPLWACSLCFCLSFCLSVPLSISLPSLSLCFLCLSVSLLCGHFVLVSLCVPIYLSHSLSVSLSHSLSVSLSHSLSVSLSHSLSVSLSHCLSISLSLCLPISLSLYHCISLSLSLSVNLNWKPFWAELSWELIWILQTIYQMQNIATMFNCTIHSSTYRVSQWNLKLIVGPTSCLIPYKTILCQLKSPFFGLITQSSTLKDFFHYIYLLCIFGSN
jgi:hypothetical protein